VYYIRGGSGYRLEHRVVAARQGLDVAHDFVVWHLPVRQRWSGWRYKFFWLLASVLFVGQLFRPHWVQRAIIRIFGGMLITRAPVDILSVTPIRKAVAVDPPTILCHPRSSAGSWRATRVFRTKQNNNALLHVLFPEGIVV
jgi:hypothetical protein